MYRAFTSEDLASVILRREALQQGYSDKAIRQLTTSGAWTRIRHGAYVPSEVWCGLDPQSRHRLLARAVLKTAHETSVLSHVSAAVEWGAPTWATQLGEVHVTRADAQTSRREAGVVRHSGLIDPSELCETNGVAVTNATRAALEVTTTAGVEQALVMVNGLLHSQATTPELLADRACLIDHWPNSLGSHVVLRLADPRLASAGETRLFYRCWKSGLPLPTPQYEIRGLEEWFRAYVDFAWPGLGVFMEFDGRGKYYQFRRDGETLDDYILREKRREETICLLTGWSCIRVRWADLENPDKLMDRIGKLLASRARWSSRPTTQPA